ncbi:MAG: ABC transporter ATP-binding protein [Gammaproteobacteria bacterium]|nr:ABC transporter ATP-binding protein [Gammaproteobacteria bacterium]
MADLIYIKVDQVKKKLGVNQALDGVSLYFEGGQMHGVIGPEGAGKTTLMRIILRLLYPNEGAVDFFRSGNIIPFKDIRNNIAYMPQQQSLYPELSIDEHMEFFSKLYQISPNEYKKRREELLDITKLGPFVGRTAEKLSGGMYKKLGLMCALLRAPEIMLLDEPTNGVDPISRREFWDLLYRLLEKGILIIVTTAYMDEAERCSAVHLLEEGKVIAEGEPRELLREQGVQTFDEIFYKHAGRTL